MLGGPQMTQADFMKMLMNRQQGGSPGQGLAGLYASRFGGQMPQAGQGAMPQQMPIPVRQGAMVPQRGFSGKGQAGGMTPQAGSFFQNLIRQRMAGQAMPQMTQQAMGGQMGVTGGATPQTSLFQDFMRQQQGAMSPQAEPAPQANGMYGGGYIR